MDQTNRLAAGTYFIELTGVTWQESSFPWTSYRDWSAAPFTLSVGLLDFATNNSPATATTLAGDGKPASVYLSASGEQDWFQITLAQTATLETKLAGVPAMGVRYALYGSANGAPASTDIAQVTVDSDGFNPKFLPLPDRKWRQDGLSWHFKG